LVLEVPIGQKESCIEGESVHKLFARKKIQEIEELSSGDYNMEEGKTFITDLGLKYQIATKYTSFIGVDEKQNNDSVVMVTRHVANQLPHNSGYSSPSYGFSMPSSNMVLGPPPGASSAAPIVRRNRGGPPPPGGSSGGMIKKKRIKEVTRGGVQSESMDTTRGGPQSCSMDISESSDTGTRSRSMSQGTSKIVLDICSCQESNGSFAATAKIATLLHLSEDSLKKLAGDLGSVWMTFVVISYLKDIHPKEKDVWALVVKKAERWIGIQTKAMTQNQKDMANDFMRTLPMK